MTKYTFGELTTADLEELMDAIKEEIAEAGRGLHTFMVNIKKPMTWEEVVEKVIDYFNDNDDDFIDTIEDLDDNGGILGDDRIYDMSEIDEQTYGMSVGEFLSELNEWDSSDDYFKRDMWGFSSVSYKDYSEFLNEDFVEELYSHTGSVNIPDEVREMFDAFDEGQDEADDEE